MEQPGTDHPLKSYYADIHPTYDRVNRVFTFGGDARWRRKAASVCLSTGPSSVLDLCAGTGDFALELARQAGYPVTVTGFDFSSEMLGIARRKAEGSVRGPATVHFVEGDASRMPFSDGQFDAVGITFGIRNLIYENSRAGRHLEEINRVLRPGGRLVILESSRPGNPLWRIINSFYLRFILPRVGGLISGHPEAYRYLARSSRNYYTIGGMGDILEGAGFRMLQGKPLFMGSVMLLEASKIGSYDG
ncbi:MAG: ubiquinone/menaquinone biosynthesis methyltransferase [Bacteroidetes bacterium]|nr:MAG: ubiquinone/menaquinone biosynthesis methyltransferase [Bacteroidota bacterium]